MDRQFSYDPSKSATAKRRPGRPRLPNPKQAVSLRLDPETLAKFKSTGPGWQRRINDILKSSTIGQSQ